ncbi:hypothetical protein [Thiobacillus sedimenti]|uniref:Aminoglycoside phosphotransferase domain-containing protein n=1 Tax=Thiobacillus sedimenti TaxID=3110231 RepID=A0ABZ1CR75_9PROT|nr:hypothetical protein [Thiobacillus sp. SCUT-2]WRS40428.1 hypothetical protein VA613_06020 [Thiobacillus sp. SCUT-2]
MAPRPRGRPNIMDMPPDAHPSDSVRVPIPPCEAPMLAAKVAWLSRPQAYPDAAGPVEVRETHMSWVFLTERHAWKLKKPVRYPYLDFATVDARRHDCEEEVRLNRRLAPDCYLGVVPLVRDAAGCLHLGGEGETVDWLVQMRRLPAGRMLDRLLEHGTVAQADIARLATRLARFYAALPAEAMAPQRYREDLAASLEANAREIASPEFGLDPVPLATLVATLRGILQARRGQFDARVAAGRIVEGHGDLRPEHVCLLTPPAIIDCLEFNRAWRVLDAVDELGYLALECERLGAPHVGRWLLDAYRDASGDAAPAGLIHFHQASRALLRAKLALWHLRDDGRHPPETWRVRARAYLDLARRHADAAAR